MGHASLMLVLLVGCAGADAMALQPAPPAATDAAPAPFVLGLHPGETMTFEVRLAGVLAGEAQLAVGEVGDIEGKRALVVKSRAQTAGAAALIKSVSDEATTVIDTATGRPMSYEATLVMGDKSSTATAKFDGPTAEVTYQRNVDKEPRRMALRFGDTVVYDAHTAMAAMRSWRASKGATRTVWVIGGRRLWRVDMTYGGEETIGGDLGNRRAIVMTGKSYRAKQNMTVEGDKPGRTFTVWLSDDADRVPLKVTAQTELGEIAMALTEYQRP